MPQSPLNMSIHVAITRRVQAGQEEEFQRALAAFFRESFSHSGVLGASMITPMPGSNSREFGILRTFASEEERDTFYETPLFKEWDQRARAMTEGEPVFRDLHGLEAWFGNPELPRPPRWKMALATLVGVYPTSLTLGTFLGPQVHHWPKATASLVISGCMVLCLTWVVMPLVTKLLHRWLHPHA